MPVLFFGLFLWMLQVPGSMRCRGGRVSSFLIGGFKSAGSDQRFSCKTCKILQLIWSCQRIEIDIHIGLFVNTPKKIFRWNTIIIALGWRSTEYRVQSWWGQICGTIKKMNMPGDQLGTRFLYSLNIWNTILI